MAGNRLDTGRLVAFLEEDPRIDRVRSVAGGAPVFLVGGSVRDLLLGRDPVDLDIAVEGDAAVLARDLDPNARIHDRFRTARAQLLEGPVDLASTRAETYPEPGALPEVAPAGIVDDLGRRDFTINAIAVPLGEADSVIDPHGGREDLAAGRLEVLHGDSIGDDPTRALRAARYVARFDFQPGPMLVEGVRRIELGTVSPDRLDAELRLFAAEPDPVEAVRAAATLGLSLFGEAAPALLESSLSLLARDPWEGFVVPSEILPLLATGKTPLEAIEGIDPSDPETASRDLARLDPGEILLARAAGAEWLDSWPHEWRDLELEIDGEDLIAEGVAPGPAIGRGLTAARRARLSAGKPIGRDAELRVALEASRDDAVE